MGDLGTASCQSLGFAAGELGCTRECGYDVDACTNTVSVCAAGDSPIPANGASLQVGLNPNFPGWVVHDTRVRMAITHGYIDDISASLRAPGTGLELPLFEALCGGGGGSGLDVTLEDGAQPLTCFIGQSPAVGGTGSAVLPMRKFRGASANGMWTVRLIDTFPAADNGTLDSLCLDFDLVRSFTSTCGDGIATFGEPCDGADLAGQDCQGLGHTGGQLECDTCDLNPEGCSTCGNNVLEEGESCDGTAIGPVGCALSGPHSCASCEPVLDECSTQFPDFCFTTPLPFASGGTALAPINVPFVGDTADVDVRVNIQHNFINDVTVTLEHNAVQAQLISGACNPAVGSDMNAWFNDDSTTPADCVAPIAVEGNLAAPDLTMFEGLPIEGDWILTVDNAALGRGGTLVEWCISLETTGS